jgi:septum formation protein
MNRLVLASASPRRKALLMQIGLEFEVIPSTVAEHWNHDMAPVSVARQLARQKAEEVAGSLSSGIVIAADTLVVHEGQILGKPRDRDEALGTLRQLSGKVHHVITALMVMEVESRSMARAEETTKVYFRKIPDEEILAYIATGEPMDKAGAYGIQEKGILFVRRIEGCYTNVVGLPVPKLASLLKGLGISIL